MLEAGRVIGRDEELVSMAQFVEAAEASRAVMLIRGEPGIGKTTLWLQAVAEGTRHDFLVLSSRASESERQLSFTALGDLVGGVLDRTIGEIPGAQARALEIALLRQETEGPPADQRAVSLGVLNVLKILSSHGPLMVAIDDVQWLDAPSAQALAFALRRLESEPVAVLTTARHEAGVTVTLGLERTTREERLFNVLVGPMTIEQIDRLLRTHLEVGFPLPVLRQIHRTSDGNPFFALELGRALQRRGSHVALGQPLPIPDDLNAVMLERLGSLSANAQEVLLVVSALSQPTVRIVKAAVGDWMMAGLAEASDGGVVEIEGDRIRFTHQLLASAAYQHAAPERRRRLHWHLASVVHDPEERARHLALGTVGTDDEAARALDQGARAARSRGAPGSAAELWELARRLTPKENEAESRQRAVEAARCHFEAGDSARARALLEEVAAGWPVGPDRSRALHMLGTVRYQAENWEGAEELFAQAINEADDDAALLATLHRDSAWVELLRGRVSAGAAHARSALEFAELVDDRSLKADALTVVATSDAMLGQGSPLETMQGAVSLSEWTDRVSIFRHPSLVHGMLLKWADRFDESRERLESLRVHIQERGEESSLPFLLYHLAELECWTGDWKRAAQYAHEGYAVSLQTAQESNRMVALYAMALIGAHLGNVEEARAAATEGLAAAERGGGVIRAMQNLSTLGFLELSLRNLPEAHRHLARAEELRLAAPMRDPGAVRFVHNLIETLIGLGRLGEATEVLGRLEALCDSLGRGSAIALAARCRALLRASTGEIDAAISELSGVLEPADKLPMPFERARTLLMLGEAQRRAKQKRLSRDALREALGIFEGLGARLWADRTREEIDRLGKRAENPWDLTPTEAQIAELVARGRTNRQVADQMFLSEKTVAANLSKIYLKMGVRSRTEMANEFRASVPTTDA